MKPWLLASLVPSSSIMQSFDITLGDQLPWSAQAAKGEMLDNLQTTALLIISSLRRLIEPVAATAQGGGNINLANLFIWNIFLTSLCFLYRYHFIVYLSFYLLQDCGSDVSFIVSKIWTYLDIVVVIITAKAHNCLNFFFFYYGLEELICLI
ncbi:hypothetical protein ACJX0J_033490, partial [Zea mays]